MQLGIDRIPFVDEMGKLGYMLDYTRRPSTSLCCSIRLDDNLVRPPHKVHRIGTGQHQSKESCDPKIAWQCSIDSDSRVVLQSRLLQTLV